jgi:pimeloyl-ACP methyl ester carboxylesterase
MIRPPPGRLLTVTLAGLVLAFAGLAQAAPSKPANSVADVGDFFVGGRYTDGKAMIGQAHVLYLTPAKAPARRRRWCSSPAWARPSPTSCRRRTAGPAGPGCSSTQGWAVYLMDQPGRGASGYDRDAYGPAERQAAGASANSASPPRKPSRPSPASRRAGPRPSCTASGRGPARRATRLRPVLRLAGRKRGRRRLGQAGRRGRRGPARRIGPAVVVTHSQAGAFGWAIGEARPDLVKAIVAVEPSGPPFFGAPPPWGDSDPTSWPAPGA